MLVVYLLCVFLALSRAESYVATSNHDMIRVLEGENDLLKDLRLYVAALAHKLNVTRHLINDALARQQQMQSDPEQYIANALTSLPLMRRMHEDVPKIYKYLQVDAGADLQHIADYNLDVITKSDLEEAISGLIRMQQNYEMNEFDMAKGLFGRKQYNAKLSTLDCLAFAQHLQFKKDYNLAARWLKVALKLYDSTPQAIYKAMQIDRALILKELAKMEEALAA